METARPGATGPDFAVYQAGALSIAIGVVHALANFEYWGVWWGYGLFFAVTALAQIAAGLALFMQPWIYREEGTLAGWLGSREMYQVGIGFNGAIVLLWIVAHTVTMPVGPSAGRAEPVTLISVVALLIMVALIWQLVLIVRRPQDARRAEATVPVDPQHFE